jgi:monovalent cation/proton antiporter MnhG/PhaG subunit
MTLAVDLLIALAVFFSIVGSLGVWLMRDPYQKIHYITLPCSVSAWLIAAAVLVWEKQKQAGLKVALIALVLFAMNGVVTQATARAAWVRSDGQWPPRKAPPPAPPEAKG